MKPAKFPLGSNGKLANAPEITSKRRQLKSTLSPKPREKQTAKTIRDKAESMVLRSPPAGESIVRYALPIPSSKTRELIAEDELVRKITKHLKVVVSNLEDAYGHTTQNGERASLKSEHGELNHSVGDDLNSFLVYCSQCANQLEEAVKEEHNILESLFKWFQIQVNQMEEISKDQSYPETDYPAPDKTVTANITQIVRLVQRLEEMKSRLTRGTTRPMKIVLPSKESEKQVEEVPTFDTMKQKIEEFIKNHLTAQESDDTTLPVVAPSHSMTSQLNTVLRLFERQSDMLSRAVKDQGVLEAKYEQIKSDFQVLSEEKVVLEDELQKMKETEVVQKAKLISDRPKKTGKAEKKKDKRKSQENVEKKSMSKDPKSKEDLIQMQKLAGSLENENKILQVQLKQALQEAERAKNQLDYFLKERKDLLEARNKLVPPEMSTTKRLLETQATRNKSLDKETKFLDTDSGGQKTDDSLPISYVPNGNPIETSSSEERASLAISDLSQIPSQLAVPVLVKTSDISLKRDLPVIALSESQQKSFTAVSPSAAAQSFLSVGAPPSTAAQSFLSVGAPSTAAQSFLSVGAPSSAAAQSFLSVGALRQESRSPSLSTLHVTVETSVLSDNSMGTVYQTDVEEEEFHGPGDKLMSENQDLMSKAHMKGKKRKVLRKGRSGGHHRLATQHSTWESEDLVSKASTKVKKRHDKGEIVTVNEALSVTTDKVSDENLSYEDKDLESKPKMKTRKQKTAKTERISVNYDVQDVRHMTEHKTSLSKSESQMSKRTTHKRKKLSSDTSEQGSKSSLIMPKKRPSVGGRRKSIDDGEYENIYISQDSLSKSQMQLINEESSRDIVSRYPGLSAQNLSVYKESVSKVHTQVSEEIVRKQEKVDDQILKEKVDKNLLPKDKDELSKTQFQTEKPEGVQMETEIIVKKTDEMPDSNVPREAKVSTLKEPSRTMLQGTTSEEKIYGKLPPKDDVWASKSKSNFKSIETLKIIGHSATHLEHVEYEQFLSKDKLTISKSQTKNLGPAYEETSMGRKQELLTLTPSAIKLHSRVKEYENVGKVETNVEERQKTVARTPSTKTSQFKLKKHETVEKVESHEMERHEVLDEAGLLEDKILLLKSPSDFKEQESVTKVGSFAEFPESQSAVTRPGDVPPETQRTPEVKEAVSSESQPQIKKSVQMEKKSAQKGDEILSKTNLPKDKLLISETRPGFKTYETSKRVEISVQKRDEILDENILPEDKLLISETQPGFKTYETSKRVEASVDKKDEMFPEDKVLVSKWSSEFSPVTTVEHYGPKLEKILDKIYSDKDEDALYENLFQDNQIETSDMEKLTMEKRSEPSKGHITSDYEDVLFKVPSKFTVHETDRNVAPNDQLLDVLLEGLHTFGDVKPDTAAHKTQLLKSGLPPSEVLRNQKVLTSELMDVSAQLKLSPSISDVVFQLGFNQVVETNINHLAESAGNIKLLDKKNQVVEKHHGTKFEDLPSVSGVEVKKAPLKPQPKNFHDNYTEHYPDFIARGSLKGDSRSQSRKSLGLIGERVGGAPEKNYIKSQVMSLPMGLHAGPMGQNLAEPERVSLKDNAVVTAKKLPVTTGERMTKRVTAKEQPMTQSDVYEKDTERSTENAEQEQSTQETQPGVNYSQSGYQSSKRKKDSFSRFRSPNYFTPKGVNISPFDNQDLRSFENKHTKHRRDTNPKPSNYFASKLSSLPSTYKKDSSLLKNKYLPTNQDVISKRPAPNKHSAKVVNISPFQNQERAYESTSPDGPEFSRGLNRKLKRSSVYKGIRFPSLSKKGKPDNDDIDAAYEHISTLPPSVTSRQRTYLFKELSHTPWNKAKSL